MIQLSEDQIDLWAKEHGFHESVVTEAVVAIAQQAFAAGAASMQPHLKESQEIINVWARKCVDAAKANGELRTQLAEAKQGHVDSLLRIEQGVDVLIAQRDTLQSELAALRAQEPVDQTRLKELEESEYALLAILDRAGEGATVGRVIHWLENAGKPAEAFLVEGSSDGKLISHALFFTIEEAKRTASVFAEHYPTVNTKPLYATPTPQEHPTAKAAFESSVRCGFSKPEEWTSYEQGYTQGRYDESMHQGPPQEPVKEVVVHADYREMWAEQVLLNQQLCAALAAPTPQPANQMLLDALEYIDSENASEEVLRRARAAIAAAEQQGVKK